MLRLKKFKGRFGNQLLQYAALRQRAGVNYQCPYWIGQEYFDLTDPAPTPDTACMGHNFPKKSSWYDIDLFRQLFTLKDIWKQAIDKRIEQMSGVTVGVHCRRGDYGTFKRKSARWCFRAPLEWYSQWINHCLPGAIVFIASDEPVEFPEGDYKVISYLPSVDDKLIYDWYTLTQCHVLLISNSTFSFTASMMNTKASSFWRPCLSKESLIPYNPANSDVVLKEDSYVPGRIGSADFVDTY